MYTFLYLVLLGTGGGILYFFPYVDHPGKAVVAILVIAMGLFLLLFRGKNAGQVKDSLDKSGDTSPTWWPW